MIMPMPATENRTRLVVFDPEGRILIHAIRVLQRTCDIVRWVRDEHDLFQAAYDFDPDAVVVEDSDPTHYLQAARGLADSCSRARIVRAAADDARLFEVLAA